MKIQLIEGQFSTQDAMDIIIRMINVKVQYHENRISSSINEEDIKFRESKIKQLQEQLYMLRKSFSNKTTAIKLDGSIEIS